MLALSRSERSEKSVIYQLLTGYWIFRFAQNGENPGIFNRLLSNYMDFLFVITHSKY